MNRLGLAALLVVLGAGMPALSACGSSNPGGGKQAPSVHKPEDCDPLVPEECILPFPSNHYLKKDGSTATGYHVEFGPTTLPTMKNGEPEPPDVFKQSDGFSPGVAPMTFLKGATIQGLPDPDHIADSLKPDCPTVLIEADNGERVPHFSELDMSHSNDARRVLAIRPVVRLKDDTRYIVAIRNVVDASGKAIAPSKAFKALRDGTSDKEIEARRSEYQDIFAKLKSAGIEKSNLQIAWDFTTASRDNNTKQMVEMRDDALAKAGTKGPSYTIDSAKDNPYPKDQPTLAREIKGTMTVPLYLDKPDPGCTLSVDASGKPKQNGTAKFGFIMDIPKSVATGGKPVPVVQFGHGLLGAAADMNTSDGVQQLIQDKGYVMFGVDWIGMSENDQQFIGNMLSEGDLTQFSHVADRLRQSFVNALLAMRMVTGDLANDPAVQFNGQSVIDPTQRYYYGNSQGGINGGVYMALSTDVTRGYLGVPGQPYSLLLNRSRDFNQYLSVMSLAVPDPIDRQVDIALIQMLWDRAEPDGYTAHISKDMLPGTPQHNVLIHIALGDQQVTPLGGEIVARTVGAVNISPVNRSVFGIDEKSAPYSGGNAMVEWDFGNKPAPLTNVPPPESNGPDTHGMVRALPEAQTQIDQFLRTGTVVQVCSGPCNPT